MMLCAWKTKTKAGTAVLELLLITCTLCIHWDCIMLCWQKVLTLHGRSKQTAWHSNFIFILKKFCIFGRPSALILPFLPFPRRNFEKRKGSPSFFQVSGKYGFLDRYSSNFENISRKIIASIKILLCSDSRT